LKGICNISNLGKIVISKIGFELLFAELFTAVHLATGIDITTTIIQIKNIITFLTKFIPP
jgi:hypothetical protein